MVSIVWGISDVNILKRSKDKSLPLRTPAWIGKREEKKNYLDALIRFSRYE